MKIKLRASGPETTIPSPPRALRMGGDDTPVNSRRLFYDTNPYPTVIAGPPVDNVGLYTPPPKNPIWVEIPLSIIPTPYRPVKACRGCK